MGADADARPRQLAEARARLRRAHPQLLHPSAALAPLPRGGARAAVRRAARAVRVEPAAARLAVVVRRGALRCGPARRGGGDLRDSAAHPADAGRAGGPPAGVAAGGAAALQEAALPQPHHPAASASGGERRASD
eukprot:607272-Prorocentrum_minimum.AAC.1